MTINTIGVRKDKIVSNKVFIFTSLILANFLNTAQATETSDNASTCAEDDSHCDATGMGGLFILALLGGGIGAASSLKNNDSENTNTAPVITSPDEFTVEGGNQAVSTVMAVDNEGNPISYTISGGPDAALFTIDADTGDLSFVAAPDFNAPIDVGTDNIYEVTVTASDGSLADIQEIDIEVVCGFVVNTMSDVLGSESLRDAILCANEDADHNTIQLDAGTYTLSLPTGNGDNGGDFNVRYDLTIIGELDDDGNILTVIDANDLDRIFSVSDNATLTLENIILTDSDAGQGGAIRLDEGSDLALTNVKIFDVTANTGVIFSSGDSTITINDSIFSNNQVVKNGGVINLEDTTELTITNSEFHDNSAGDSGGAIRVANNNSIINITGSEFINNSAEFGGAIRVGGGNNEMTITESIFQDNWTTSGSGGAILMIDNLGTAENSIDRSLFFGNKSANNGGAIENDTQLTIQNTTISNNETVGVGGAIQNLNTAGNGPLTIINSTITENIAGGGGSGINDGNMNNPVYLQNSIVAQNAGDTDISGVGIVSLGNNLIGNDDNALSFNALGSDIVGSTGSPVDAHLLSLADNGGPTLTHMPSIDSDAIDNGVDLGLMVDQRGLIRPFNDVDIGAVEVNLDDGIFF